MPLTNNEFISIKADKDHQYYTLPYLDVLRFIKHYHLDSFTGGLYAALYMAQCNIDKTTAFYNGLLRYYFKRIFKPSPLEYLYPKDHHKILIKKYSIDPSSLIIGLTVGRLWAQYKCNGDPFSWVHIENELKEIRHDVYKTDKRSK